MKRSKTSGKRKFIIFLFILLVANLILLLTWNRYSADSLNGKNYFTKRYFMLSANLVSNTETDRVLTLMDQAGAIGYNGMVLGDNGGQYNSPRNQAYIANAAKVVAKGQALSMAVIPHHFSSHDPYYDAADKSTIKEALPVQGTRYQVDAGVDGSGNHTTTFSGDSGVSILNADLENWTDNTPNDFSVDGAGTVSFRDQTYFHSGSSSLRFDNPKNGPYGGNNRAFNSNLLTVKPNVSYTFSVWIKTENLTDLGKMNISAIGQPGDNSFFMSYSNPVTAQVIEATQDWKQYQIIFTTQNKTQLRLYGGMWSSTSTGSFWLDDFSLTENGMAGNLLNRTSLNPVVKSNDGLTTYIQNQDYYLNGDTITVPMASSINAGDFIRIDWYQDPIGRDPQANACYEAYFDYLKADGLRLQNYFGDPKGYMSGIDEWRTANWDPACKALHNGEMMTGGEYMAYTMERTYDTIKQIRADADVYVWNDMFDPYMNAVDNYYSVNGTVANSWEGLSNDVIVVNWNSSQTIDNQTGKTNMQSSLQFFNNRNNHQILSATNVAGINNYLMTLSALENSSGISGVDGFLYTSWASNDDGSKGNFDQLEAMADVIKAAGRWGLPGVDNGSDPPPPTPNSARSFTYKNKITITGTKDAKVKKVLINNKEAQVDNNANTWSLEVDLINGQNTITIVGQDQNSKTSSATTQTITRRKIGDFNNDTKIDAADFTLLLFNWGSVVANNFADFNEDGKVDGSDFTLLLYWWGR